MCFLFFLFSCVKVGNELPKKKKKVLVYFQMEWIKEKNGGAHQD